MTCHKTLHEPHMIPSLHHLIAFQLLICFSSAAFNLLGPRAGSYRVWFCVWHRRVSILFETPCHRSWQKQQKYSWEKNGEMRLWDITAQEIVMQDSMTSIGGKSNTFQGTLLLSENPIFVTFPCSGVASLSKNCTK